MGAAGHWQGWYEEGLDLYMIMVFLLAYIQ